MSRSNDRSVKQPVEVLHLNVSFRAVPEIQEAVNAAFSPVMGWINSSEVCSPRPDTAKESTRNPR